MNELNLVLKTYKRSFVIAGVFSMVINLLMLTPSLYMLQVYDRVIASGSVPTLIMLTLIVLLMLSVIGALEWLRSRIMIRVSSRLDYQLSGDLYNRNFKNALLSNNVGISTQPLNDLTGLRHFLTGSSLFAFFDAPWLPFYLGVMFMFHPWIGMAGLISAIILGVVAYVNERVTHTTLVEANELHRRGMAETGRNLRNAEVVAAMGMLPRIKHRWQQSHYQMLALQGKVSDDGSFWQTLSKILRLMVQSLILGLGAFLVLRQEITPGLMIAGSILLGRALAPVDQMIGGWKQFVAAREQYSRLQKFMTAFPIKESGMRLPDPKGAIALEQVFVGAPGERRPIIRDINFNVEPGTLVGIIGQSASGKSTLARALLGIWSPLQGCVRLDGADIKDWNRDELGPFIGYLPQDIELFAGSISENIARFGELDPQKVVAAAHLAGVHDMILRLPNGYDTQLGAEGGSLSGGQRQRIALARAVYGNPRLVILDEPNSNLDDHGEKALSAALVLLKQQGSTVFIISHRTSILMHVDKLLVLKEGNQIIFDERKKVLEALRVSPTTVSNRKSGIVKEQV